MYVSSELPYHGTFEHFIVVLATCQIFLVAFFGTSKSTVKYSNIYVYSILESVVSFT